MESKLKFATALLILAAIVHWVVSEPSGTEVTVPGPNRAGAQDPGRDAADPADRAALEEVTIPPRARVEEASPVIEPAPMPEGAHLLRVLVDAMSEEDAQQIEVTLFGLDADGRWLSKVQETWRGQGSLSHFALDPFLDNVALRYPERDLKALNVMVGHSRHLSETVRIQLDAGETTATGQVVYEARVSLDSVEFWPEFQLSVRDAHTREHLTDVELHMVPTSFMGIWMQPGRGFPYTQIGQDLESPIGMVGGRRSSGRADWIGGMALSSPSAISGAVQPIAELAQPVSVERGVVVFAGVPGYAWGSLVIDASTDADRELLLEPGASLGVRLAHAQLEAYRPYEDETQLFVVKLRDGGGYSYVSVLPLTAELVSEGLWLQGLEPGDYAASVEMGGVFAWRERFVLAREELALAAGESREVVLSLGDPPDPPVMTTLSGVLSLPEFDGLDEVELELFASDFRHGDADVVIPLREMQAVGGALPSWAFRVEDLPAGTYQLKVSPLLQSWIVEIPPEGREDLELVIAELAEVQVETFDARTGTRVPLPTIRYRRSEPLPGQVDERGVIVQANDDHGQFRFWTVPGEVNFHAWRMPSELGYGQRGFEFHAVAGRQTLRYELESVYQIVFEFRDNGAVLPHADAVYSAVLGGVSAVEHDGRVVLISIGKIDLSAPGIYEVSFEGVGQDRFLPVPARRVVVQPGTPTKVIVELQRR